MTDIGEYILNLYPTREAAEAHASLLKLNSVLRSPKHIPIQVTWWPLGINKRNHAWALIRAEQPIVFLQEKLTRAWRCNIIVGKFLPLDGSPDPETLNNLRIP